MKIVSRAIKAITDATEERPFSTIINHLNKEDWKELMKQLPEDRVNNPRIFFKVAKALAKIGKKSKIVKGFIIEGEDVSLQDGLKIRINDLYRPPNTPNFKTRIARD